MEDIVNAILSIVMVMVLLTVATVPAVMLLTGEMVRNGRTIYRGPLASDSYRGPKVDRE